MAGFVVVVRFDHGIKPLPDGERPVTDGLLGTSVWQSAEQEQQNVLILNFRDQEAAKEHGRRVIDIILDAPADDAFPPDSVSHITLSEKFDVTFESATTGSYMMMGHVQTNPGLGWQAKSQISATGTDIKLLPGYAGRAMGSQVANDDNVWFFAFWDTVPSLTLPEDIAKTSGLLQKIR